MIFLSKLLPLFLFPLGLALGLVLVGLFLILIGRTRLSAACALLAFAVLSIAAMPAVADRAIGSLEARHPPRAIEAIEPAEVAIVLGGAVSGPLAPRTTSDLGPAADRVLHAARLYRAGKVRRVLVAAGNIEWMPGIIPEAELIRDLLIEWGIEPRAITLTTESRNTVENAREIAALQQSQPFKSAWLVTSAFHMPRAMAVFEKAGLAVQPAATDVRVVEQRTPNLLRWLPDAHALAATTLAVKEWIGLQVHRWRGEA